MARFSSSITAPASTADHHYLTASDLPKSGMSIRQTIRRGAIRTNWTLASYITSIHGDAISCIDLLCVGTLRYIAIGSYDGVLSIWSMSSPTIVHREQKFTLQSAPMRTIQVTSGAIIVCDAGHVYYLPIDGQPCLWYELSCPLIFAGLAVPSSNLVIVSKSNIILMDVSDVTKTACSSDTGEQLKELTRKHLKEIPLSDIVDSAQSRAYAVNLDGVNEHIAQVTESADVHHIASGTTMTNNLEDSETENEDVRTRTAYIACACLLSPSYIIFVCSHGFFYLYNLLLEEVVFKSQLGRNAIATYMSAIYTNSITESLISDNIYISAADGSLTVWRLVPEKKELQPIAIRSNYGSVVSCIALSTQQSMVLGLSNGKIKVYAIDNINHSVGVCRAVPDDQLYQTAGISCILWLDPDTVIAGSWDRGVFIYTRPRE